MPDQLRVDAGELDVDEVLEALEEGKRVVVRTEMLGVDHEVTLRHDGSVYYCDTPTTLHRHESRSAMRRCLTDQGYVRPDGVDEGP